MAGHRVVGSINKYQLSRRSFITAAALAGGAICVDGAAMSAREIVSRIRSNVSSAPPAANAIDAFIAGDPGVAVRGIATTGMATMDVLKQAASRGLNLVISYHGVYYGQAASGMGGRGGRPLGPNDPAYSAKKQFIEKNEMAVFQFRDQWAARPDNPLAIGLGDALGWGRYRAAGDPTSYQIPAVKFDALVADIRKNLRTRAGIRVVGDRAASIQKVVVLPGEVSIQTAMRSLPESDLLIAGVTQEWDVTEYAFDGVSSGWKKGFIMLGRVVSEDPGMKVCSEWIKSTIKGVPVEWIAIGDPYWRPAKV